MRGIILAGGSGSRLHPLTQITSKQLLPVYDKPLVYYPLSVLMLAHISEILIISTPSHIDEFRDLLGDGRRIGIRLEYAEQAEPRGLADALLIGRDFVGDEDVCLILGDNIFYGYDLPGLIQREIEKVDGCTLFGYPVADPERFGVATLDRPDGARVVEIEEKPEKPSGNLAVTGLYLYSNEAVGYADELVPSARGELEITDLNRRFVEQDRARLVRLGRGITWLDTGTPDSLLEAGSFVQMLQKRQGVQVACLEEVAYQAGLIDRDGLERLIDAAGAESELGGYLAGIA